MHSWYLNYLMNYQPVPHVQLVIQQYIETLAGIVNNQPGSNVQLVIQ